MNLPPVVSQAEWEAAHGALLAKEKEATRARDALAAERRRLPMVRIDKEYVFEGPGGKAGLADLLEGRRQLVLYHGRTRRRGARERLDLPRPDAARPAGDLGGLAGGVPADPALPVVAPPRRIRVGIRRRAAVVSRHA
jgi:hypothetical protein